MPIPLIPATHSEGSRPAVPNESGHPFRSIPATPSERSDAGVSFFTYLSAYVKFFFFSHGFSFQLNSVAVVNQSVQDGIGKGGIPDMIMPMVNRELTGNQGGTRSVAVLDDFEQISSFGIGEWS